MAKPYKMTISRLTVDKLGVKLYDRVSAVIAELVANSYDADAKLVTISAPMGELLATRVKDGVRDKGFDIEITDDGIGMTPEEVNEFFLVVGAERRNDPRRGDTSRKFGRKVMGRKGVGKLAPFGVCKKIEVISAGGQRVNGKDERGKTAKGYLTAHLILEREAILTDTDEDYYPKTGKLDGFVQEDSGTIIRLTHFDSRYVPTIDEFERQLAQRFGVASANWKIKLLDSLKAGKHQDRARTVGEFEINKLDGSEITFTSKKIKGKQEYVATGPNGKVMADLKAGFDFEGRFYPLEGWVAYSKLPYKDDLMAGVRVYCRGKIAAQTHIFNMKAGFTGEYDVRSYLVGELHTDWLDESEDLIRTDRHDILWSHPLGSAFEAWGQAMVKKIGTLTQEPRRKKAWDLFEKASKIKDKIEKQFPAESQKEIRENTEEIAKLIAKTTREEDLRDPATLASLVDLSLLLGPHITLDKKLREAADSGSSPIAVVNGILKTARIAELAGFGKIADDRVRVIKKVQQLKDKKSTLEEAFQALITEAPWLVNPQWSPISANQSFETLKSEFQKFYKKKTGNNIVLEPFGTGNKRADFVMSTQDGVIQIIEIKKPDHKLKNEEMDRIDKYIELMGEFLSLPGNQAFSDIFRTYHVTLVCDGLSLTGVQKRAFESYKSDKILTHLTWNSFLMNTKKMHEAFLNQAEKMRKHAAKDD
jgi:hypothetical protein